MTRILCVTLIGLATVLASPPVSTQSGPTSGTIQLVLSGDSSTYRAFEEGFRRQFGQSKTGLSIHTTLSLPDSVGNEGESSLLLIAVGTSALESLLRGTDRPIIAALVPSHVVARWQNRQPDRRITGIFIDQAAHRHTALARSLLPEADFLGLLSGTEPVDETGFRQAAERLGMEIIKQTASDRPSLLQAVRLLARDTDGIIVLPSTLTTEARNLRGLLLQSFRAGVPVLGFSPGLVDAGAIGAVYSEPEAIGADTARLVENILDTAPDDWPVARHPDSFEVAVNRQVARAIGLNIPPLDQIHAAIDRSRP